MPDRHIEPITHESLPWQEQMVRDQDAALLPNEPQPQAMEGKGT